MMNSTVSDVLSRSNQALEVAEYLKTLSESTQNLTELHKELLEINLSIIAHVEESKRRLVGVRTQLVHEAKSSQEVVEVLSNKCKHCQESPISLISYWTKLTRIMSETTPPNDQSKPPKLTKFTAVSNNDGDSRVSQYQQASSFVTWYRNMIDNERQNFSLYLSDDASLEWFGRTIKTRQKISAFLNNGMQCTRHDFTTVEVIAKIQSREVRLPRKDDSMLASPLHSPELIRSRLGKRKHSQPICHSPEWAEGCKPDDDDKVERKRLKPSHIQLNNVVVPKTEHQNNEKNSRISSGDEINCNGDGVKGKGKCVLVTPPNVEIGQGDGLPSTSSTYSDKSHEALNAQLPKFAVECNGYIEFTRSRNSRSIDSMKWERKCKVQISYSIDPLNIGEYIIWAIQYHDENKCRRNLLDAFEKVSKEENF